RDWLGSHELDADLREIFALLRLRELGPLRDVFLDQLLLQLDLSGTVVDALLQALSLGVLPLCDPRLDRRGSELERWALELTRRRHAADEQAGVRRVVGVDAHLEPAGDGAGEHAERIG